MKKTIVFLMRMLMALWSFTAFAQDDVMKTSVTIYHTNDVHGYVQSKKDDAGNYKKIGIENVAALKKSNPDSLLVDAGDFMQGGLFANLAHGLSSVEVMNAAGYDLAILGNHEFDWGCRDLEENAKARKFPIISANVTIKEDMKNASPYLAAMPKYVVKEVNGVKIAFFGIDTPTLYGIVSPEKLEKGGVEVRTDIKELAGEIVAEIKEKEPDVNAIIAVTHCGYSENSTAGQTSYDVAGVEGVDAVIDGHDHENRLGNSAKNVNGTLVVSTGTGLEHLGRLTLEFAGGKLTKVSSKDAAEDALALEADSDTLAVLNDWDKKFEEIKSKVVFYSPVNFWGGNIKGYDANGEEITASIARRGYTNAGRLMGDSRVWQAKKWLEANRDEKNLGKDTPIVSILGGGSVRGPFKAGDVTLGDLMGCYSFSFENAQSYYVLGTPMVLYDAIEHGVNIFSGQDENTGMLEADGSIHGRFPQIAGASYVFDITQPAAGEYDKENKKMPQNLGSRVQSITLDDGTVLDRNDNETPIIIITGAYEIGGGDSYWMLGALNNAPEYGGYQEVPTIGCGEGNSGDVLIDFVKEVYGGKIPGDKYPIVSDRIKRVNDVYKGEAWDSNVTVTKDGSETMPDTEFTVYVDGNAGTLKTDSDGVLALTGLTNGAHEVRIIGEDYDSGTLYIDNYAGLLNQTAANTPGELPIRQKEPDKEGRSATSKITWVVIIAALLIIVFRRRGKKSAKSTEPTAEVKPDRPAQPEETKEEISGKSEEVKQESSAEEKPEEAKSTEESSSEEKPEEAKDAPEDKPE
jgi:5'-nucleotidase/UDP-sugar diphosphatase